MEFFTPKFRRNPNEKVHSVYRGVAPGQRVVTSLIKKHPVEDRMETTRAYEPGLPRGQGGSIGVFILGGMETTLDEMEYLLERRQQKKFDARRTPGEIVSMCHELLERRNARIKYFKANPSEAPKPKKDTVRLHLPVGYHLVSTPEPGLKLVARI